MGICPSFRHVGTSLRDFINGGRRFHVPDRGVSLSRSRAEVVVRFSPGVGEGIDDID